VAFADCQHELTLSLVQRYYTATEGKPRPINRVEWDFTRLDKTWKEGALNTTDACQLLKIDEPQLYALMNEGKLAYKYLGRHRLVSKVSLAAFLNSRPKKSPAVFVPKRKPCPV
jgi:excisionase family DNA binding protein